MRFSRYFNNISRRNNIFSRSDLLRMRLEELLEREDELDFQNNLIGFPEDEELEKSPFIDSFIDTQGNKTWQSLAFPISKKNNSNIWDLSQEQGEIGFSEMNKNRFEPLLKLLFGKNYEPQNEPLTSGNSNEEYDEEEPMLPIPPKPIEENKIPENSTEETQTEEDNPENVEKEASNLSEELSEKEILDALSNNIKNNTKTNSLNLNNENLLASSGNILKDINDYYNYNLLPRLESFNRADTVNMNEKEMNKFRHIAGTKEALNDLGLPLGSTAVLGKEIVDIINGDSIDDTLLDLNNDLEAFKLYLKNKNISEEELYNYIFNLYIKRYRR